LNHFNVQRTVRETIPALYCANDGTNPETVTGNMLVPLLVVLTFSHLILCYRHS